MLNSLFLSLIPFQIYSFCIFFLERGIKRFRFSSILLLDFIGLHLVSFFSSSFVEEEHQTVFYFVSTFLLVSIIKFLSTLSRRDTHFLERDIASSNWGNPTLILGGKVVMVLAVIRGFRLWNQSGVKWIELRDLSDIIFSETFPPIPRIALVILSLGVISYIAFCLELKGLNVVLRAVLATAVFFAGLVPTVGFPKAFARALFFLSVVLTGGGFLFNFSKKGHSVSFPFLRIALLICVLMVNTAKKIPMVTVVYVLSFFFFRFNLSPINTLFSSSFEKTVFIYYMSYLTFFAFGNTNTVATLEFGGVYTVLDNGASLVEMGFLTFIMVFTGPLLVLLCFHEHEKKVERGDEEVEKEVKVDGKDAEEEKEREASGKSSNRTNSDRRSHSTTGTMANAWINAIITPIAIRLLTLSFSCLTLAFFRSHLFVWSVFAPKFLYEVLHMFFILFSSLLFGLLSDRRR